MRLKLPVPFAIERLSSHSDLVGNAALLIQIYVRVFRRHGDI